jgi:hypothetical protein
MPIVVPNEGERRLLEFIVGKSTLPSSQVVLHLYKNDVDLTTDNFTSASFQEADAAGYSSQILNGSSWTISTDSSGVSSAVYGSNLTFNLTAAQDIYGYYVTTTNSSQILWAEEFPGSPFSLPSGGGQITIRPQIQLA